MKTKAQLLGITSFPYFEYDDKGNISYLETSNGVWWETKCNDKGNVIYLEDNNGDKVYSII